MNNHSQAEQPEYEASSRFGLAKEQEHFDPISAEHEEVNSITAFEALSDSTRQEILRLLQESPQSVNKLGDRFTMSRSAVSQHLAILHKAGLVNRKREGRNIIYEQGGSGWIEVEDWIARHRLFKAVQSPQKAKKKSIAQEMQISGITIAVTDQERSLRFYRDVLEFTVVSDRKINEQIRWISVAPPGDSVALILHLQGTDGHGFGERVGKHTGVILMTNNIQTLYPQLLAQGVHFESVPTVKAWGGIESTFADLDYNLFEIVQFPH